MKSRIDARGLNDAMANLGRLGDGVANRVLADALNHTANQARQALRTEMSSVFDRPTPFTLNAVRIFTAKPSNLQSALWVKDEKDGASGGQAPEAWVAPQVFGGQRKYRRSEQMLRDKGILPAGMFVVPGAGARLDQYGNISRGQMIQLLSGLSAFNVAGFTANASGSRRSVRKGHAAAFFVIRRGKAPIGIAERRGKQVAIVLAFVRQPTYRPRFDFHGVVRRVAENDAQLEANIDKALTKGLARL